MLASMDREISSGGVVIRHTTKGWLMAVIEPQREPPSTDSDKKLPQKMVLALPKGLIDPGEKPEQTALREVFEETGITATPIAKLTDIKYVYTRSWGDGKRIFKIVSFYLLKYESGKIGEISEEMKVEVKSAQWIPLEDAAAKLAYKGEREVVVRAQEYLKSHSDV
jgi:8-oxo-dGTP pyrophosphatase MutT (NUDIX family)